LREGIRKYAGVIAVAAAFAAAVISRGGTLSDPAVRKELIFCSAAIVTAVILNWGISAVISKPLRTTVSYIGWLLVSLSAALELAGPAPFSDAGSSAGLIVVFTVGVGFLLYAYLGKGPDPKAVR
jgi:hypothetical protein